MAVAVKAGTGIKRMRKMAKSHGLKEPVFEFTTFFTVTFFAPEKGVLGKPDFSGYDLNERQKKGLEYVIQQEKISTSEYMKFTKTSKETAIRDLKNLVEQGILSISGPKTGRGRHYTLRKVSGLR